MPSRVGDIGASSATNGTPAFAVIDVETTGLSPRSHRILELAIVRVDLHGSVVDEWTHRFNPDGPVGATHIHGITDADVRHSPRFHELAPHIFDLVQGVPLVAHNARFDVSFLEGEFASAGLALAAADTICTLEASHLHLPQLARRRLLDCCEAVGVRLENAHSALGDARATAGLLHHYLQLVDGDHGALVSNRPRRATSGPKSRGGTAREIEFARIRAAQRKLPRVPLLSRITAPNLLEVVEEGAPAGMATYLESVLRALEDGLLSGDERAELAEVADLFDLSEGDRDAAHRALLLGAAHRAVEDGTVSRDERQQLLSLAALLGQRELLVDGVLDEARVAHEDAITATLRPLPRGWSHGDALRVGDRIAFTGCEERWRERMESRAAKMGVRVTSGVSRLTTILVTDGSVDGTKASDARAHGTRIVDPSTFEQLLDCLQPRLEAPRQDKRTVTAAAASSPETASASETLLTATVEPSAVRAWARAQGIAVADRGRLSHELTEAYRRAH
ncbi:exonuclease domain-containing protein [Agrococcus sp. DT81.2]|uniref:exonuclease domain-containing protein n=1 Tax=Agrococcus sp. DT81.2 TaxID=3393414 RepID=UPI003CE52A29